MKAKWILAWVLVCAVCVNVGQGARRTVRDEFGIPHIYGDTDAEMAEEYGFQVARDRLMQLELIRRSALGTLAELLPEAVAVDVNARINGYTLEERRWMFQSAPEKAQEMISAYVRGINRYLRRMRLFLEPRPIEETFLQFLNLRLTGIRNFTVEDVIAMQVQLVRGFGEIGGSESSNLSLLQALQRLDERLGERTGAAIFEDLRWINDPMAPVTIPERADRVSCPPTPQKLGIPTSPDLQDMAAKIEDRERQAEEILRKYGLLIKLGSYAWAIAPEHSSTGHALLFGGPQTGFSTPPLMHLVELRSGEGVHTIGMGFVGGPAVLIGHSDHFAWTSTTGVGDNTDIYIEQLTAPVTDRFNPPPYRYNGKAIPFQRRSEIIRIFDGSPGRFRTLELQVFRSVHGPIISTGIDGFPVGSTTALAKYRNHFLREADVAAAFLEMNKATSLEEFDAAVRRMSTSHNFLFADRDGNIAYWQAGEVRVPPPGVDQRLPRLGDGRQEPSDEVIEIPFSLNPRGGVLANWNNKPRRDYQSGDSRFMGKQFRILDLMDEILYYLTTGDMRIDLERMNEINKSIASVTPTGVRRRFLFPYIEQAVLNRPTDARMTALTELRDNWNGHAFGDTLTATTSLPGETLFDKWLQEMIKRTFGDELAAAGRNPNGADAGFRLGFVDSDPNALIHALDEDANVPVRLCQQYQGNYCDDINTPEIETCEDQILAALDETMSALAQEFGTSDISRWVRPRGVETFSYPLNAGLQMLGLPPITFDSVPRGNRSTYMQIIDVGPTITGIYSIPLGQSSFVEGNILHPNFGRPSPFFDNLHPLFRDYQFIEMLRLARP